ncbi:hypothetical protein [Amphritea sp.]|uniref:hypothetical protein n=1 Tax=Amphritea sp. TaxID=1872502 RepID=UPI003561D2BE
MMRWLSNPLIYAVLSALLWAGFSVSGELSGPLDGMSFSGYNGEKGRQLDPDEQEEIIFRNGLFHSVSCDPYNFGSSVYSATVEGGAIRFEAVTESPTHGKITWQGVVEGPSIKATFVWTKERWFWDIRKEYWFMGTLKP